MRHSQYVSQGAKRHSQYVGRAPLPVRVSGGQSATPSTWVERDSQDVLCGPGRLRFSVRGPRDAAWVGKLQSVRADRTLSRSGLWATGPRQLTLPVEARGLSEAICATAPLPISPDYSAARQTPHRAHDPGGRRGRLSVSAAAQRPSPACGQNLAWAPGAR